MSLGTFESVSNSFKDWNLEKSCQTKERPRVMDDLPSNGLHSRLLAETWSSIRERASVHGHAVVDAARVAMQDLLANERPAVDFGCNFR